MTDAVIERAARRVGWLGSPLVTVPGAFTSEEVDRVLAAVGVLPLEISREDLGGGGPRRAQADCVHQEARLTGGAEWAWIYQRLWAIAARANTDHFGFTLAAMEVPRYLVYGLGDQYRWHHDQLPTLTRKLALTVQLAPPAYYTGGDFQIMPPVQTGPRDLGTALVIPAYAVHQVTPITAGVRRALVVRFTGPPLH